MQLHILLDKSKIKTPLVGFGFMGLVQESETFFFTKKCSLWGNWKSFCLYRWPDSCHRTRLSTLLKTSHSITCLSETSPDVKTDDVTSGTMSMIPHCA